MLLQNSVCLENLVVSLLQSSNHGLSAAQILELVEQKWKPYSRRGIYKELERLEREGIIMRSGGHYTLRLAWLVSLHSEVEDLMRAGSNPELLKNFLPAKGEELQVRCSDLVRWDQIWTQLMLTLHAVFPTLPMFIWAPRHWFNLTHPEIDRTFVQANEASKNLRYCIIGGRGFLDKHDQRHIARKSTAYSFRVSPFEYDRNHYYWVIGDYMGISSLSTRTAASIDQIYDQTRKLSDLAPNTRQRLLTQKCNGSIRCFWAPQKAEKYRQKFLKFFGLSLDQNGELLKVRRGEL